MKSYSEQRKDRLSEAVFDYLSDEDTTPDELLTDFIKRSKIHLNIMISMRPNVKRF